MYKMQIIYLILGITIAAGIPLTLLKLAIYYSDKNNKNGKG
jgi:hypothetical protein